MAYSLSVHDAMGVIPGKLVVERKNHIPGNLMLESHEIEFEESEKYLLQVDRLRRSPGRVLLQQWFACSKRTGLSRRPCYDITEQSTCLSNVPEESVCNMCTYVIVDVLARL